MTRRLTHEVQLTNLWMFQNNKSRRDFAKARHRKHVKRQQVCLFTRSPSPSSYPYACPRSFPCPRATVALPALPRRAHPHKCASGDAQPTADPSMGYLTPPKTSPDNCLWPHRSCKHRHALQTHLQLAPPHIHRHLIPLPRNFGTRR